MKQMGCEHESGVIRAFKTGEWSADLRQHAAVCRDCGQALRLAEGLRSAAREADRRCTPPDAHWVLERSRRRSRELAVRRMSRMLTAIRLVAGCYVIAAAGWLMRGFAGIEYRQVAASLPGTSSQLALLGATVAAVCVAAGLWPMLRAGK